VCGRLRLSGEVGAKRLFDDRRMSARDPRPIHGGEAFCKRPGQLRAHEIWRGEAQQRKPPARRQPWEGAIDDAPPSALVKRIRKRQTPTRRQFGERLGERRVVEEPRCGTDRQPREQIRRALLAREDDVEIAARVRGHQS